MIDPTVLSTFNKFYPVKQTFGMEATDLRRGDGSCGRNGSCSWQNTRISAQMPSKLHERQGR